MISYNHVMCGHQHLFSELCYSLEGSGEAKLSPKGWHISATQLKGREAHGSTATAVERELSHWAFSCPITLVAFNQCPHYLAN
jgi:hypothetical protein